MGGHPERNGAVYRRLRHYNAKYKRQHKPRNRLSHRKNFSKTGYAKEAARAVRDWTFENTPFGVLYSYMKSDNVPSFKTAEANGMKKTDEFVDSEGKMTSVYSITRKEFIKLKTEK